MLVFISGIALALTSAIVVVVVRALRRSQRERDRKVLQRTTEEAARQRAIEEARRKLEEEARAAAEREAQRRVEEEARNGASEREVHDAGTAPIATKSGTPESTIVETEERRRALKYRPPSGAPSLQRPSSINGTAGTTAGVGGPSEDATRVVPIELRILFQRGGSCRVTLLPKRREDLPEECTVSTETQAIDLVALEDEWYQDVVPDDLGTLLRAGSLWTHKETGQQWLLAGREIFVLGAGTTHRGFVSCSRLELGREHVVLCTESILEAVEDALHKAGCGNWMKLPEADGAPPGWVVVVDTDRSGRPRGIVPMNPVPLDETSDIVNVLRPIPDIEISLEGGVPLGYSSWLAGHPPAIRIFGDVQHAHGVLIDGKEAVVSDGDAYRAPGWDDPGPHQVWCNNMRRGYSLIRLERTWEVWPAYAFPSPGRRGDRVAICGPLVRTFTNTEELGEVAKRTEVTRVPQSNPVLLGAVPGQIFEAVSRQDLRGAKCLVSPPFAPVWALPAQPFLCDKASHYIILVGELSGSGNSPERPAHEPTPHAVSRWCRLILDASRKGLAVEPAAGGDLWRRYKRLARELWRQTR
jgi:hypothetical protein